ncbi:MAG: sugar-binding domain-containing protein, partial [Planctomycetota bacterium]
MTTLLVIHPVSAQNNSASNPESLAPGRHTLSLDGVWHIVFDPANLGRAAAWQNEANFTAHTARREITVPSCWEEIEQDYEGVAFYGRHFSVPESWRGKTVRLQFDAVNYIAEVWVNDEVAGRHEGGYGPFEMRIDDLLEFGEDNFVSLRVLGPIVGTNQVIDGIGQSDMPHWRGAIAGGIWQSVRLVATGGVFVDDVFITPRLDNDTAGVQVTLQNAGHVTRDVTVQVSLHAAESPERAVASQTAKLSLVPGPSGKSWTLAVPDARYWSPSDPHLYTAHV